MKKTLPILIFLFFNCFFLFSQSNGWFQIDKPKTIHKIVPDDTHNNIVHLATNIGYIKFNFSTNQVVDFLNITSQNPAIGEVLDISLNPTNDDVALALHDAIAIYTGANLYKFAYYNSNLTIGESSPLNMKVKYNSTGDLYAFKPGLNAIQKWAEGIWESELPLNFPIYDVEESIDGNKVYYATWNTGLEEYDKNTDTYTTYNTSNSNLISNNITCLDLNNLGELLIGTYSGFNVFNGSIMNTFQDMTNFYPVFSFSENSNGSLVVNSSRYNTSYSLGYCVVDVSTNTWFNYREDNSNCVNENFISSVCYAGNDNVFLSPYFSFEYSNLIQFDSSLNSCTQHDINYLNGPEIGAYTNSYAVRTSDFIITEGIEFAFTGNTPNGYHSFTLDPNNFNGDFLNQSFFPAPQGELIWSVQSECSDFICETNNGWIFIDEDNSSTVFNHNIVNYYTTKIKTTSGFCTNDGTFDLIHKGPNNGNIRIYRTQCNINTNTCSISEEIFTETPRDLSQDVLLSYARRIEFPDDKSTIGIIKKNIGETLPSVETRSSINPFSIPIELNYEQGVDLTYDPISEVILDIFDNIEKSFLLIKDSETVSIFYEDPNSGVTTYYDLQNDNNNDNTPDNVHVVKNTTVLTQDQTEEMITWIVWHFSGGQVVPKTINGQFINDDGLNRSSTNNNSTFQLIENDVPDAVIGNELPSNLIIYDMNVHPYNTNTIMMSFLTNYGFLIKNGIDITNLTLGANQITSNSKISIYPNPASDIVTFSDERIETIQIYDLHGRIILQSSGYFINVKTLSKGMYIIKGITPNKQLIIKQLIKK